MFLHSALSAGTYIAGKRALAEISPVELALVRFGLASLVHAALLLRLRPSFQRKELTAPFVSGGAMVVAGVILAERR